MKPFTRSAHSFSGLQNVMVMRNAARIIALAVLSVATGCGGTWIDDNGNFHRVFGFSKPADVRVVHSYYWKSSHWSSEYQYFVALEASPKFVAGITAPELMKPAQPSQRDLRGCGPNRPSWFLPKPLPSYEMWVPKSTADYRVFRDKSDGALFVCDLLV